MKGNKEQRELFLKIAGEGLDEFPGNSNDDAMDTREEGVLAAMKMIPSSLVTLSGTGAIALMTSVIFST